MNPHLEEQTVLDFVSGALDGERLEGAHLHVDACATCRQLVARLAGAGSAERADPDPGLATDVADTGAPTARGGLRPKDEAPSFDQVDEYRLLELLGRGGMASVYRARDTLLDRDVAVKFIASRVDPMLRERLLVEARAVARIRHPNVVTVHRVGVKGEQPYIVYELIAGRTLEELPRPMPWPKVLELGVGIARGLVAAHQAGVLHRDIKPSNLMFNGNGDVVLVDFGLAKIGAAAPEAELARDPVSEEGLVDLTMTGVAMGTPRYMPPEAWRGEPATAQSDVYSLGAVLYVLCSGHPPHSGASPRALSARVIREDAQPLSQVAPWVPPSFAEAIDRCLLRDPSQRFSSAEALLATLEKLQLGRAFDAVDRLRERANLPPGNPYRGPDRYESEHRALFFGRAAELRGMLSELARSPFLLLTGEAGVGKSSLCRAGLLPLVRDGALGGARRWSRVVFRPGARPLDALWAALRPHLEGGRERIEALMAADPERLLVEFQRGHGYCSAHILLVDPLDELVTESDPDEARQVAELLSCLARPAPAFRMVATSRTENLSRLAGLPGLGAAIGSAPYLLVEPRSEEALREIITGPARLTGLEIEPATVDSMVAAIGRGEMRLRDLQITLADLWNRHASV